MNQTPTTQKKPLTQKEFDQLVRDRAKSRLAFMAKAYPGCLLQSTEYLEYGFLEIGAALMFLQWDKKYFLKHVKDGHIEEIEKVVGQKFRKPSLKFVKPGQKTQKWYRSVQLTKIRLEIYGMDDSDPEVLD